MNRRIALALAAAATLAATVLLATPSALAGGGCHNAVPTDQEGDRVVLAGSCFTPTVTRIPVGGEVTFTSADDMAHTVTGLGFSWGTSGDLKRGDSASFAFPDEGIFPYACMYHPGMVGAVVVGDGIGTSAAAAPVVANPSPPAPARDVDAAPAADTADIAGWWPVLAVAIAAGGLLAGFVAGRRVRALRGRERTAAA